MRLAFKKLIDNFNNSSLESHILVVSMLSGMLICFASSVANLLIGLDFITFLVPFTMGLIYILLIYDVVVRNNFKLAAYGSLSLLTIFVFPALWLSGGGLTGSIPYFYIFMIFLTAVVLNKLPYKAMIALQTLVVVFLIYIEANHTELITPYDTPSAQIIDMGYSLIIIIALVFFLIRYIMKKYNQSIMELKNTQAQLEKANAILHHSSITDPLTDLHNRRYIKDRLEEILDSKNDCVSSVIMIDIDHFKSINDTYGHDIGDVVLKKISLILKYNIPYGSHLSRIGGEEFLVVMEDTNLEHAMNTAEHLRSIVEKFDWEVDGLKLTISLGLYSFASNDSLKNIFKSADTALYQSKNNGRNRLTCFK